MPDPVSRLNAALSGRYRVERELGEGGMATVYLAEDLKHHRKVALKLLRPELAAVVGAGRFLAEIETTASLQHPHILPLFDSGEADGLLFYVMPHVEGESLRDRLDREHQLPVDDAVRIAANVAEALDYAHAHGVIHRDIKPANILLQAGKPVISDFGIALAVNAGGAGRLTETGLSLGTPHYMSPEQATGDQTVGPATDIWALGCVLYEMLVGEPPYTGGTPQAVLGKIITAEVASPTDARRSVPPNVDAAIRKALEKVPADRFRSAGDFARALADAGFRHSLAAGRVAGGAARGHWNRLTTGFAALAAFLAIGLVWVLADSRSPAARGVARFDLTPAEGQRLPLVPGVEFSLTPDGSRVVFVGTAPDVGTQLWQRAVDDLEAVRIPGTEDALGPSVSPDGRSVAFQAAGEIMRISLDGGPPVALATGIVATWGPDGMIYFSQGDVIHRVDPAGGPSEAVTTPTEGRQHRYPSVLPDGRGLLVSITAGGPAPAESRIAVVGPEGGEAREILTGTMARYSPTGHVIFTSADGTLMAAPFDARRLEVTGPSVALIDGVVVKSGSASQFMLSESGALLYAVGGSGTSELMWVGRDGRAEPVDPQWQDDFAFPSLSPDGTRLAVTIGTEDTRNIWVKQLDLGPSLRLTLEGDQNDLPTWGPDGQSVMYRSNQAGSSWDLWTKRADGSAPAALVLDVDDAVMDSHWAADGVWLVYATASGDDPDIFAARPREGSPIPVAVTRFRELAPALSPDGRWLAYTSNETGTYEVHVVPFPDASGAKWLVSTGGGAEPVWSRDGRELFYRNRQGDVVAVPVETETTFSAGTARTLFSALGYRAHVNHRQYDVTPDGERFIMLRPVGNDASQWILAENFVEELRERVR